MYNSQLESLEQLIHTHTLICFLHLCLPNGFELPDPPNLKQRAPKKHLLWDWIAIQSWEETMILSGVAMSTGLVFARSVV